MLSTLEILSQDSYYTNLREHFLFKTLEEFQKDCLSQRRNLKKEKVYLFPRTPNKPSNTDNPNTNTPRTQD